MEHSQIGDELQSILRDISATVRPFVERLERLEEAILSTVPEHRVSSATCSALTPDPSHQLILMLCRPRIGVEKRFIHRRFRTHLRSRERSLEAVVSKTLLRINL